MGFGHRIYRVRDPRADALKAALATLQPAPDRLELASLARRGRGARAAAASASPTGRLQTNVEFYTALLLDALGFPREAFTAVFAMGRIGGWIAHAREQAISGRLIRPKSHLCGTDAARRLGAVRRPAASAAAGRTGSRAKS